MLRRLNILSIVGILGIGNNVARSYQSNLNPTRHILTLQMLETVQSQPGKLSIKATVRRFGVYLDNYSIIRFAKERGDRRERLVRAFERGADLMFSPINAAEIIGPQQSSLQAIRDFLDAVGPHWVPVEGSDLAEVIRREEAGAGRADVCISSWFMSQFFAGRNIQLHGEQRLDPVEPDFFRLGFVLDWLGPRRADIRSRVAAFERDLREALSQLRHAYDKNQRGFHELLPVPHWNASRPATFVWNGLLRLLVLETKAFHFKKGDGADLCHAVIGPAFAAFATLDKQWRRRVLSLPEPNGLARIYYEPELDQLVGDIEDALQAGAV